MPNEDALPADERVIKKIYIDPATIAKMKKLSSLYSDELPDNPKEIDILSFFVQKTFETFLSSGEIDSKIEEIKK
jgi:hypothetical protein